MKLRFHWCLFGEERLSGLRDICANTSRGSGKFSVQISVQNVVRLYGQKIENVRTLWAHGGVARAIKCACTYMQGCA